MSRTKSLIKNTGILMIAKMSTQFVNFLLIPLYTALLSTEEYGEVDIYTSFAMIIVPFLTLQLEMGLFRYFITCKEENEKQEVISSAFVMVVADILIVTIIYFSITAFIVFPNRIILYCYYLSIAVSTVLLQVCRARGDNLSYGFASFISSGLAVVLNVLFVAGFHWNVKGIITASIIAQLVSSMFILLKTKTYRYFNPYMIKKSRCRELLTYSVPLVLNQVSSWGVNYSSRLIILNFLGMGMNGIYALASKFSNITNTFFGMYNLAWTESVVRSIEDGDNYEYLLKIFTLTFNFYLILITGIINLLPFFFKLLVNENYYQAYFHVPFLLVAIFFSGMAATIGSIYIAYNRTKSVSMTTTLAAVGNVAANFLLLKPLGLYAASVSSMISFALLFFYRYIFVQKILPLKFESRKTLPQLLILAFAWGAYINKNTILIVIGLVLNILFVLYLLLHVKRLSFSKPVNKNEGDKMEGE